MIDYEEVNDVLREIEPEDSDFVKEHGDPVTCVVKKVLSNRKTPDTTQRHQIFYSRCSVKDKICNFIIDNVSCENIISKALVDYLKLDTKMHSHPCDIGWIKQGLHINITYLCQVPISIGKHHQDSVTYNVVDMDKCHILLGRPWQ